MEQVDKIAMAREVLADAQDDEKVAALAAKHPLAGAASAADALSMLMARLTVAFERGERLVAETREDSQTNTFGKGFVAGIAASILCITTGERITPPQPQGIQEVRDLIDMLRLTEELRSEPEGS